MAFAAIYIFQCVQWLKNYSRFFCQYFENKNCIKALTYCYVSGNKLFDCGIKSNFVYMDQLIGSQDYMFSNIKVKLFINCTCVIFTAPNISTNNLTSPNRQQQPCGGCGGFRMGRPYFCLKRASLVLRKHNQGLFGSTTAYMIQDADLTFSNVS